MKITVVKTTVVIAALLGLGNVLQAKDAPPEAVPPRTLYSFSGQIFEKGSKDTIVGGSLYLEAIGNTTTAPRILNIVPGPIPKTPIPAISGYADIQGKYKLLIPAGTYRLTVAAEGYKETTVAFFPIDHNLKKNFFLEKDGFSLPEELVSSSKVPKTQISHEALSKAELTEMPGTQEDILKAVQNLPGIVTAGASNGQLLVRGSGPNDNQYDVDNIPIGFPYHFGVVSSLDSNLVKDIDFYSGGSGPQFPSVMGGLVDLSQDDPRSDRWGFRADVNILLSEMEVEGPITSNSSLSVSARQSYMSLLVHDLSEKSGTFELPDFNDYQIKYSYNPSIHEHWDFVALGSTDSFNGFISDQATVIVNDPEFSGSFNYADGYNNQGINFRDTLDDRNKITNTLYHTDSYLNFSLGPSLYEDNSTEDFGDKFSISHDFDRDTRLIGGVQYDHIVNSLNANYIVAIDENTNPINGTTNLTTAPKITSQGVVNSDDFSAYLDQNFKAFDRKLEFSIGARMAYVNSDNTVFFMPRASAAYRLSGDTTLKASYGYYDEAPDSIMGVPYLDPRLGNPHLAPERSVSSVLGIEQKLDDAGLVFKVEAYEKDLSDLIVINPITAPGASYLNTGTGYARGIEFFLRRPPAERFFGWIAYSLSTSQRQDSPGSSVYPFNYNEPNVLTAVGEFKITPRWDVGAKVLYSTGLPYTPILGSAGVTVVPANGQPTTLSVPQYAATNSAQVPDYFRVDLSTSFKTVYDTWEWRIYLDIVNVLNTQNVLSYTFYPPDYTSKTALDDLPLLPYLGFEVKY